ncbi:MAG TPA: YrhK family protein [Ilumatobacteraceae bacterium]|nr:YrhK family protein [Ilumatobacteraceae bacterium]
MRTTSWVPPAVKAEDRTWLARLCCRLDERRWVVAVSNVVAAALFVAGCIGFYWPGLYTSSVTMFLCGSVLFLLGALASALLEHGPST